MEASIHYNIVYIGRLCAKYCESGLRRQHMDEAAGFCYDLLFRLMCLTVPLEGYSQWDEVISLVDNTLKEYVEFDEKAPEKVQLTEYNDNGDCENIYKNVDYYLWYFFSYTYHFASKDEISRSKCLWISLLLPYLYRVNQFGAATIEDLNKLLKNYPIDENTLETLQKSTSEFKALLNGAEGMDDDSMPKSSEIDAIIAEANAGLKIAVELEKKARYA